MSPGKWLTFYYLETYVQNAQKINLERHARENYTRARAHAVIKKESQIQRGNNNNNNNFQLGIYSKPTQTHTTIHFKCNCPLEHKLSASSFI
jgi:hypothetical protein